MLDQIRRFFDDVIQRATGNDAFDRDHAMRCASAALVREDFDLSAEEAEALLSCADAERRDATDYFQFTRLINDHFSAEEKISLIESLWRVAYADQRLSSLEEHLVRKVAELIYVPHGAFISAKHRAEAGAGDA